MGRSCSPKFRVVLTDRVAKGSLLCPASSSNVVHIEDTVRKQNQLKPTL